MGKIKCTKLAAELNVSPDDLKLKAERILKPDQWKGGKSVHFTFYTEEGADLIRQAYIAPLTVAKRYKARGWQQANNPRWVFCVIEGKEGKHPVAVPRKLQGKLIGKTFFAEAIEDKNGVTFRHEALGH